MSSALTTDDLKDGDVTRLRITNSCSSTTPLSPPARGCCCCLVDARQSSISAQMAWTAFASSACSKLMDAWVQNKVVSGKLLTVVLIDTAGTEQHTKARDTIHWTWRGSHAATRCKANTSSRRAMMTHTWLG
jgi:hypothetical protein